MRLRDAFYISTVITALVMVVLYNTPIKRKGQPETPKVQLEPNVAAPEKDKVLSPYPVIQLEAMIIHPAESDGDAVSIESQLNRFIRLSEKAILDPAEKIDLDRSLSDPRMMRSVENLLLAQNPGQFTRDGQRNRFNALLYIEKALTWKENPQRLEVIAGIEKIILAPLREASLAGRKVVVGDKMELYSMLVSQAPETARSILENARGSHLEKILTYATERITF